MSGSSLQHIRLGQGLGQPPGDLAQLAAGATAGRILAHGQAQSVRVAPRGAVGCGLFRFDVVRARLRPIGCLVTRGLPTDRTLLFVIAGAPGRRRAISDVFGSRGLVASLPTATSCANVLGHLPDRLHASVGKALRGCVGPGFSGTARRGC